MATVLDHNPADCFQELGFSRGALYSRQGGLIASVAQEGLIRLRKTQEKGPAGW